MSEPLQIEIRYPDSPVRHFPVHFGVYTVGSDEGNKIILPGEGVSWRHAVLTLMSDESYVEDLRSETGIEVDRRKVNDRQRVFPGQHIRIGPYTLLFKHHDTVEHTDEPVAEASAPQAEDRGKAEKDRRLDIEQTRRFVPKELRSKEALTAERAIKRQIQDELLERLDLKRLTINQVREDELRERVKGTLAEVIHEIRDRLPSTIDRKRLAKEVYDEAVGLGPLEDLLEDPQITEIMVNGPSRIYVEREGKIFKTDRSFIDEDSVHAIIERIVSPIGRRIDESSPYVDARLPDGSRVNAIIAPLSLVGPCLTIRLFAKEPFVDEDLCRFGTVTPELCRFIRASVKVRKNIVISGGTGSGKTTLLNVVSNYLPDDERIITIEDAAELRLPQEHVVRLEARPPNIEGRGAITIRDLVRNALRMRPDRIVVGECRGGEALDMLQAMNTGHEGSLTTVHANSPRDVISRLETMVLMSGMELPIRAIREQLGAAIHLIIQLSRFSDGTRKVSRITEVVGLEGDKITMQDIFEYQQTGVGPKGEVIGGFRPTGAVPSYADDIRVRGIEFDHSMFDAKNWPLPQEQGQRPE